MTTDFAARAHESVNRAWSDGLRPDPLLTVSQWADKNRYLSSVVSGEPGLWRTSRVPYMQEIMDCLSPSSMAESVALMKATQISATECGNNWIGYIIHQTPGPMMIVLPTTETAKRWSKQRLAHVIADTPCLRGRVADARSRDSGNTVLMKEFQGGLLIITGANSAVGLRSMPARFLFFDEIDGYPVDVDGEGSPVSLAEQRSTGSYKRGRKSFKVSTPTTRGRSNIETEFQRGDQRYLFVPCPHCSAYQRLRWENFHYEPKEAPTVAYFKCQACEARIDERWKTQMLPAGIWTPTFGIDETRDGVFTLEEIEQLAAGKSEFRNPTFHLNGFYSPIGWLAWIEIAQGWIDAQKDPAKLKVFVNTKLAETWVDRGEAPDNQRLFERREQYELGIVPRGGLFLTAGADVQADRIEVEIVAWGYGKESWSVGYEVLPGDTSTPAPWTQLEQVLARDWPCAAGGTKPIIALAIDTGYRPQMGYAFARRHPQAAHGPAGSKIVAVRTVVPIKGTEDWQKLIVRVSNPDAAKKRGGIRIVEVGTACAKQELYDWLRLPAPGQVGEVYPPGFCHLPNYEKSYFQGLCSESRVIRATGRPEWVKDPSVRNEPLDCRVYARTAAAMFGMDRFKDQHWAEIGWEQDVVLAATVLEQIAPVAPKAIAAAQPTIEPWTPRQSNFRPLSFR